MDVLKWAKRLAAKLPLKKIIVFESSPDYACNTYPVYVQLRKDLPRYKMVWYTSRNTPKPMGVDAVYYYDDAGFWNEIKHQYYLHFAKAFVSSNRVVEKKRPMQVSLFLCHGSKTKKTRGSYEVGEGIDYVNVQSHFFDDIISYEYNCDKSRLVYLGYPRCDSLFAKEKSEQSVKQKILMDPEADYLVWLPTFRKHKTTKFAYQMDLQKYENVGMPLVYSIEELRRLNRFLTEQKLHIIYKPHPAQDVSCLKSESMDHIHILYDKDLADKNLQLYDVLAGSEALITDYSSVFFDYLLLDKPIVTTTDDIDEWKKMTGFAFDLDAFLDEATHRVADLQELMNVVSGLENAAQEKAVGRKRIRELTNLHLDGNSARRVADFIEEKIGE